MKFKDILIEQKSDDKKSSDFIKFSDCAADNSISFEGIAAP